MTSVAIVLFVFASCVLPAVLLISWLYSELTVKQRAQRERIEAVREVHRQRESETPQPS